MQSEDAMEFFERVTQGTKKTKTITLEHSTGAALEDVEMHPVDKGTLASVIEQLPNEVVETATDDDGTASEAEAEIAGSDVVSEDAVSAFENLCRESLQHPDLSPPQMNDIIDALAFDTLFEIGSQIIEMSMEERDAVSDFHVRT